MKGICMNITQAGHSRGVRMRTALPALLLILCLIGGLLSSCAALPLPFGQETATAAVPVSLDTVPAFSRNPYVEINGNVPFFTANELTDVSFEHYSELDGLGRCGEAVASVGHDLMPDADRGSIGSVKPSGWVTVKYDFVDGKYLYNRCHLIGYQLTGENANEKNLITGTRYLNIKGMLPFENMVADFVKETGYHVMYRVTPLFEGNNLVASGVLMEAQSVEDSGEGIRFNVYCYNVQPGVVISYADGSSRAEDGTPGTGAVTDAATDAATVTYILNTATKKFHKPDCYAAQKLSDDKKESYTGTRDRLIQDGYEPCGTCKP